MTALAEATPVRPPLFARLRQRLAEPIGAFTAIWRNHALRRLEYAWVGSIIGTWAYGIALGVYAYGHGGAAAVGIAGLIRTLPTVLFAPIVSSLGDRYPRVGVMVGSDLVRGVLFTVAAVLIIVGGAPILVYVISGALMLAGSAFRPAQAALLPSLTDTPEQLTAMNVVSSTVESVGFFAGPALGGVLLAVTSAQMVFAVSALSCAWSALMLVGLGRMTAAGEAESARASAPADTPAGSAPAATPAGSAPADTPAGSAPAATVDVPSGMLRESLEGFRTIGSDRRLLTLVSLFTAQTVVAGALNVFVVVLALRLYDSGPAGVGTLNAALGVGGIIGAAAAAALVGGQRLARGFAFGLIFWGAPLLLVGGVPGQVVGLLGLATVGLANTVIDVSGFTLLQRAVPDHVLARVFGVLETVLVAGIGLGALVTPPIISALGVRGALVAVGGFLPLLTALTWARLRVLDEVPDAPDQHIELLESLALFRGFPRQTIELLASRLGTRTVEPDEVVIREGDDGDRFYVIEQGHVTVEIGGTPCAELGPGEFFGEIALLRDVPRTATVRADDAGTLLSLTRDDFVPAVRMELLKSLALFRPLPAPTLEFLASKLECRQVSAGEVVIREGDEGDRFYVIAEGRFEVDVAGEPRNQLGVGDFFGEIALLRRVRRTATVVARTDGVLFSLRRDEFVPAVTGSAPSNAAADEVVGARLSTLASRPMLPA